MLLGTNILYGSVLLFVSNVHMRCELPSPQQVDARFHVGFKRLKHWVTNLDHVCTLGALDQRRRALSCNIAPGGSANILEKV